MKRRTLVIAAILFIVVVISSCKTHERCPAYGSNSHNQTTKTVA